MLLWSSGLSGAVVQRAVDVDSTWLMAVVVLYRCQSLMVAFLFCLSGLVAMATLSSVHGDPRGRGDIFHGG